MYYTVYRKTSTSEIVKVAVSIQAKNKPEALFKAKDYALTEMRDRLVCTTSDFDIVIDLPPEDDFFVITPGLYPGLHLVEFKVIVRSDVNWTKDDYDFAITPQMDW